MRHLFFLELKKRLLNAVLAEVKAVFKFTNKGKKKHLRKRKMCF